MATTLQSIPVSKTQPTTGQVLAYDGAAYVPSSPNPGDITAVNTTLPLTGGATSGAVTLDINNFTGDAGAGGLKGTVPAPAAGDAIKFLRGDATWASAGSTVTYEDIPGGRLTLTSGTPVMTTGVVDSTTIYYTPYTSNVIYLYNGSAWERHTFSETSLVLTASSGYVYDVFVYNNAGTLALELSAAWFDDTTRTDAVSMQDGVLVKTSDKTRRLIGTLYADQANKCTVTFNNSVGGAVKVHLWNLYNQVLFPIKANLSASSTTTGSTGWIQCESAVRLYYVCGYARNTIFASGTLRVAPTGSASTGFGIDSFSANSATNASTASLATVSSEITTPMLVGIHLFAMLVYSSAAPLTYYGVNAGVGEQCGFHGGLWA